MKFDKKGPKTFPKPSQTLPKPSRNRSQQALGAHVGPMLRNISILDVKKTGKRHPRVPKRRPKPFQTPQQKSPKPSQIEFWGDFLRHISLFEICMDFSLFLNRFLQFLTSSNLRKHCKNLCLFDVFVSFYRIAIFPPKNENSPRNQPQILPKSFPKPRKIDEKSKTNRLKKQDDVRCVQKAPKLRKKCEKWAYIRVGSTLTDGRGV